MASAAGELMSDALTIARFCFPETHWVMREDEGVAIDWGLESFTHAELAESSGPLWNPQDRADVSAAESVVIERGLAEQYGRALAHELWPENPHCTFAVAIAQVRTAPLTVVIRAILSAIDSNPNPSP